MGTWGAGLYSDDEACDVRNAYRKLLGDGIADAVAERRALEDFARDSSGVPPVVWLALADTQSRLGRLSEYVRDAALHEIDSGNDLAAWKEEAPRDRRLREQTLARLRSRLTGPQPPAPKRVRREWAYVSTLQAGDMLAKRGVDGQVIVLRVREVDRSDRHDFPLIERVDIAGDTSPAPSHAATLAPARTLIDGRLTACRWRVAPNHRYEQDWSDAGWERIAQGVPVAAATGRLRTTFCTWEVLDDELASLRMSPGEPVAPEPDGI